MANASIHTMSWFVGLTGTSAQGETLGLSIFAWLGHLGNGSG